MARVVIGRFLLLANGVGDAPLPAVHVAGGGHRPGVVGTQALRSRERRQRRVVVQPAVVVAEAQRDEAIGQLRIQRQRSFGVRARSAEHTSELQSLMRISYAVFCLQKKREYK